MSANSSSAPQAPMYNDQNGSPWQFHLTRAAPPAPQQDVKTEYDMYPQEEEGAGQTFQGFSVAMGNEVPVVELQQTKPAPVEQSDEKKKRILPENERAQFVGIILFRHGFNHTTGKRWSKHLTVRPRYGANTIQFPQVAYRGYLHREQEAWEALKYQTGLTKENVLNEAKGKFVGARNIGGVRFFMYQCYDTLRTRNQCKGFSSRWSDSYALHNYDNLNAAMHQYFLTYPKK